jgi:hypothetical protein
MIAEGFRSRRSLLRAKKWHDAALIKLQRGCENDNCPISGLVWHSVDLDFDHLDSSQKKGNVSDLIRSDYSWATIMKEIDKCRVLCKICHARSTKYTTL